MPFDSMVNPAPGFVTTTQAAGLLGVGVPRVLRLIKAGDLPAAKIGNRWMIQIESIDLRLATRPDRGRRYTAASAWGILFMAAGQEVPWLTPHERRSVRRVLDASPIIRLRARLVSRGRLRPYRVHPGQMAALRSDPLLMLTGMTAAADLRLGLVGPGDRVDAYIDERHLADLVQRHHLRPSSDANAYLRVIPTVGWHWPPASVAPIPAVALDLLDDPEPRAQQVGRQILGGSAG